VPTAHAAHERRVEEREAGNAFSDTASNPGGVVQQLVGNLGWGQFKMKKRPDNSSALLFKGPFDTHAHPHARARTHTHHTTGGTHTAHPNGA
jgi:hypothetical protein